MKILWTLLVFSFLSVVITFSLLMLDKQFVVDPSSPSIGGKVISHSYQTTPEKYILVIQMEDRMIPYVVNKEKWEKHKDSSSIILRQYKSRIFGNTKLLIEE